MGMIYKGDYMVVSKMKTRKMKTLKTKIYDLHENKDPLQKWRPVMKMKAQDNYHLQKPETAEKDMGPV